VPDLPAHVAQAKHNEQCANFLLIQEHARYRDWAITAAFYAAVHLAEACFTTIPKTARTGSAADLADEGKHTYRQRKIKELAFPAWRSYRKLQDASYNLRYLARSDWRAYYNAEAARLLIQDHLPRVRFELERAFGVVLH
jgi:hypothetical protein